jgi:hypothetical protein
MQKNYLSATYTNSTSFTNYDQLRLRVNVVYAKCKKISILDGNKQNYRESATWTSLEKRENGTSTVLSKTGSRHY